MVIPQKKDLFKTLPPEEKIRILTSLSDEKGEVLVWEKEKDGVRETFETSAFDSSNLILSLKLKDGDATQFIDKKILINFKALNLEFFSSGMIHELGEKDLYYIKFEKDVFKFEQRQSLRLPAEYADKIVFKVTPDDENFHYNCLDVSSGGIGLKVSKDQKNFFSKGKVFSDTVLDFNKHSIKIPKALIRYTRNLDEAGEEIHVGLLFQNLPNHSEDLIKREVYKALYKVMNV